MSIKFLCLEIERKTDIVAITALLLSMAGILYQLFNLVRGPEVTLAKPRQVVVYMYAVPDDPNKLYLALISTVVYVNSGQQGNNAVVTEESISFDLANKKYTYIWDKFVSTAQPIGSKGVQISQERTATPFVVPAGGAEAHETFFGPRFGQDFIDKDEFVQALESFRTGEKHLFKFTIRSKTLNDGDKIEICKALITTRYVDNILKHNNIALNCN
ncbi:hypothetical protein [Azotobacter chroococcum]|uniref:Uncharacterized protein n=1 Tax=Azotobacter chroococcum TaxID=353 RepID=A0AAP9YL36_9GAMM|nr:hypothetical protein [Azotobacter chroococcum]QQE91099.1 hypothetical protein GKQ51_23135 [Azotobacter chroococcum]